MSKQELTKPSSQDKKLSKKKNLLFKLIASLFPLFILFLLEILLRFFDYGDNMDLFIRSKNDENLLVLNPSAARKYFVNEGLAPTGNREFFKKKKDKNTFRVFVLGESTTIGYPYFHNGSFSRWLLYRLTHTLPDKQFEIINLSLTGVNSYTVLDFAKELIRYEPDAVLIYCGQNEYYGALGVGSTNKLGGNKLLIRLMLKLRTLRTIQLLSNCYEKILHAGLFNEKTKSGTLMQMMVADQQIAYQSKLYYRGIEQFRSNLNETLCLINSQHIPVFVSTLVSNDKDLKPFIDIAADSAHFPGFKTKYEAGLSALGNHDSAAADSYFKKANEVYDKDALCNYYLGVLACGQAKYKVADNLFSMARDLDGLRFRAPSELNVIIRELCKTYPYAHLVDSRTAFENFSNDHLIGNDLMVDHVHPNLKGYGIISDAFYRAIKEAAIIAIPSQEEMSLDQLEQQMPITKVDSLSGVYRIARLKKSWPFQEIGITDSFKSESKEQTLAYEMAFEGLPWKFAIDSLYNYYIAKNDLLNAARVMQTLVLEYPAESSLCERTGMLFGKLNDFPNAVFYFRKAFNISPTTEIAHYLFVIYLKLDKPAEAMSYLDYSIQNSSQAAALVAIKSLAGEIMELQKKYTNDSTDVIIPNQIANLYFKMGNKEAAEKYVEKVLQTDNQNKDALSLLSKIRKG